MSRSKSKYSDKQPRNAVRVADESGVQDGRVPPGRRRYGVAKYKAVTLAEASANLRARQEGSLPPIRGGLDFDELPEEVARTMRITKGKGKVKSVPAAKERQDQLDDDIGLGLDRGQAFDPFTGQPEDPQNQIVDDRPVTATTPVSVRRVDDNAGEPVINVMMEMEAGSMTFQATEILQCKYALTIVLPLRSQGATFIPKPGSEMVIGFGEERVRCFFPGAHFTSERLGAMLLVFVKADVKEA